MMGSTNQQQPVLLIGWSCSIPAAEAPDSYQLQKKKEPLRLDFGKIRRPELGNLITARLNRHND